MLDMLCEKRQCALRQFGRSSNADRMACPNACDYF